MWRDLKYSVRTLSREPGLACAAILTLALGIGPNVALFSAIDATLLRPLPFPEAGRLVSVRESNVRLGTARQLSPANFRDWRNLNTTFDSLAAWYVLSTTLEGAPAEEMVSARITHDFFSVLPVRPVIGRVLDGTDVDENARVMVVSEGLWQRRYGGDPGIVERSVQLDGESWQIVGVIPEVFDLPHLDVELWVPWNLDVAFAGLGAPPRDSHFLQVAGRLARGRTLEHGLANLSSLADALAERHPTVNAGWSASVNWFVDDVVGDSKRFFLLLAAAVGCLLLLACINVASLLLARALRRTGELAIRTALGASTAQLLRQQVADGLLLASAGTLVGILFAYQAIPLLHALEPGGVPRVQQAIIDGRALAFAATLALVAGLVSSLLPAVVGLAAGPTRALAMGDGHRRTATEWRRLRAGLVVLQTAAAVVLLIGAGLLIRSFGRILTVDPGFDPSNLLVTHIQLDAEVYSGAGNAHRYYNQLLERLTAWPDVAAVSAVTSLPMSEVGPDFKRPFWRQGDEVPAPGSSVASIRMSMIGYFATMGIARVAGRDFEVTDGPDAPPVAIVNERLAGTMWPGQNLVGRRVMLDYRGGVSAYEVIGVVEDVRHYGLRSVPQPEIFLHHAQVAYLPMNVVLRSTTSAGALSQRVRDEVLRVDSMRPAHSVVTMDALLANWVARDRFAAALLATIAGLALTLTAIGIYGLVSYSVAARRHEIGIRAALGARPGQVLALIVRGGTAPSILGTAIGLVAAAGAAQLLSTLLYEISATDPWTYLGVAGLTLGTSVLASGVPAWRASRGNPIAALRVG